MLQPSRGRKNPCFRARAASERLFRHGWAVLVSAGVREVELIQKPGEAGGDAVGELCEEVLAGELGGVAAAKLVVEL